MHDPASSSHSPAYPAQWKNAALLVIGHGSTENPDSSAPTHAMVDALRERNLFAEVHAAFWKEEASMREALAMINADTVYVVPGFISEGYFTKEIIPRELGIPQGESEATVQGKRLIYSRPVGVHPSMTPLLLKRAREVAGDISPADCTLLIVGHGTGLNTESRLIVEQRAEEIRSSEASFAEVVDTYMEEKPLISDWAEIATKDHVVIVPFFIADGLHSYQDIPVMLGIETEPTAAASQRDVFRNNPYSLRGKTLYYSSAIGTDPSMADVILDLVRDATNTDESIPAPKSPRANQKFLEAKLGSGELTIGQVLVRKTADGEFSLTHVDDRESDSLRAINAHDELRRMTLFDATDEYRPLRSANNLQSGWVVTVPSIDAVLEALDFLYPAAVGVARSQEQGTLPVCEISDKFNRQTGMYHITGLANEEQTEEVVAARCAAHCLKTPLWEQKSKPSSPAAGTNTIPLLCPEACNMLVADARRVVKRDRS
ncbi:CbiX/SirB N-terminal domain-containing protein [Sulfuriroseicoccus oceanibius]|uniref:Cobalamin biosynthesis protein CbiX n=1 Tax=Sulfuriroseicoccus oceanibius TaxID=2707525 RepID=A0A6B3LB02_9BACT|nr:CbiX/SirB N-terminal domain-containing protein [Sulfuriroseicoccus oceanibius]QQL44651.1 hypothetical protein G3M56_012285 [Sulfuriroseicoccus oceanibius]